MRKIWVLIFACFLIYSAYILQKNQALFFAIDGFSPVGWMAMLKNPDNFARDFFPEDFYNYSKSLFMHIYPLLNNLVGLPPEQSISLVIPLEMLLVSTYILVLVRELVPLIDIYKRIFLLAPFYRSTQIG